MSDSGEIINRVASSGLVTINLEDFLSVGDRVQIDVASHLFQGLVLKEKDFRAFLEEEDWAKYNGKNVSIICSADAIVPTWAFMLIITHLSGIADHVTFGTYDELERELFLKRLAKVDPEEYRDARVVIKGCSNFPVPISAYCELTRLLTPVVKSLMFGEPCSTVPLFKKKKLSAK